MEATALGVKNIFNSIAVDNLVVNDTIQAQTVQTEGTTTVHTAVVATLLEPETTLTVDIGSPSHRFKRAYVDDLDVGASRPNKYLKTNASGVVEYVDENIHDPVTLGTANGLSLSGTGGQVLNLATSTPSTAGAMSASDKTILNTLNTDLLGSTINIGVTNSPAINTINLGTGTGPTTINIGASGDTINLQGTTVTVDTQNANVTDAVLTLNKGGVNANSVGVQILGADPAVAAEIKTNGTGTTLQIQGVTGVNQVEIGGVLNVDQSAHTVSVNHNSNAATTDFRVKNANTGNAAGSVMELAVHNSTATITKFGGTHSTAPERLSLANASGDIMLVTPTVRLAGPNVLTVNSDGSTSGTCDLVTKKHDAVTIGTANGLSLSGQQLSLATATTSTNGALSSVDKAKLEDIEVTDAGGVHIFDVNGVVEVQTGTTAAYPQVKIGRTGGVYSTDIVANSSSAIPMRFYDENGLLTLSIDNNGRIKHNTNPLVLRGTTGLANTPSVQIRNSSDGELLVFNNNGTTTGACDLVTKKHDPVTLGTANGLALVGQQLSLSPASVFASGAMTDIHSRFMSKVEYGTLSGVQIDLPFGWNVGGSPDYHFCEFQVSFYSMSSASCNVYLMCSEGSHHWVLRTGTTGTANTGMLLSNMESQCMSTSTIRIHRGINVLGTDPQSRNHIQATTVGTQRGVGASTFTTAGYVSGSPSSISFRNDEGVTLNAWFVAKYSRFL